MIEEEKTPFWQKAGKFLLRWSLSKHFAHIYLRPQNYNIPYNKPVMLCINHSCRWDVPLSLFLSESILQLDSYLMAAPQVIQKYPLMCRFGCFEADSSNPIETTRTLKYASTLISGKSDRCLIMFPQGRYKRSYQRPLDFRPGFAQIARITRPVIILPVAFYYEYFIERIPEAFVSIGPPVFVESQITTNKLVEDVEVAVTRELDALQKDITNNQLDEFIAILEEQKNMLIKLWHRFDSEWIERAKRTL